MKNWTLVTSTTYDKQFSKLDRGIQKRILLFFQQRVLKASDPRLYAKQLSGELSGYWSFRVGDYRIIADIVDHQVTIIVLEVGHRRHVYDVN